MDNFFDISELELKAKSQAWLEKLANSEESYPEKDAISLFKEGSLGWGKFGEFGNVQFGNWPNTGN